MKLLQLEVYPSSAEIVVGDSIQFCAYFRFTSGHVTLRPEDIGTCGADYLARFTIEERDLTLDERAWITCTGRYVLDPGCHRLEERTAKVTRRG